VFTGMALIQSKDICQKVPLDASREAIQMQHNKRLLLTRRSYIDTSAVLHELFINHFRAATAAVLIAGATGVCP
jgi:hypothetical protein